MDGVNMKTLFNIIALATFCGIASAAVVTVEGDIQIIDSIFKHNIDETYLVGMDVSVYRGGVPPVDVSEWTGSSATGTNWNLSYLFATTDTNDGIWTFTNTGSTAITKMVLDAFGTTMIGGFGQSNAVFDIIDFPPGSDPEPFKLTPGSELGGFTLLSGSPVVTAKGAVALAGDAPLGDLYRWLEFDFSGLGSGLGQNESISFKIDSDKITPVPLPATVFFFGSALMGLLGFKRKKLM